MKANGMSELQSNQVLAVLSENLRERIAERLHREELDAWHLLRDEGAPIRNVYFPIDGVVSIVSLTEEGSIAEAYTVGRDGVAGAEVLLGTDRIVHRSMIQVPGVFYRMDVADYLNFVRTDEEFNRVMHLYLHCLLTLAGQSASCHLLHGLAERCARWLLITHDRVGKDSFDLTHDILSTMLGVHRPAVTLAAGALQKAGLIKYSRGCITVMDRERLEQASCECYGVVEREFRRVLGGP